MAMKLGLALLLTAILAKVESPRRNLECYPGEYYHSRHCCKKCPAGTHVEEHCNVPHAWGRCSPCTNGENYIAHDNDFDQCLPCGQCKHAKIIVRPCTVTSNTECQCKDGYFCPPGCEECFRCKKRCPEGKVIVQKCNATADAVCGMPSGEAVGTTVGIILGIFLLVLFPCIIVAVWCLHKKKCRDSKGDKETNAKDCLIHNSNEILSSKADTSTSESHAVQQGLRDPDFLLENESTERSNFTFGNSDDLCEELNSGNAPSLQLLDKAAVQSAQFNALESDTECPEVIVKNSSHKELSVLYYGSRHVVPPRKWKMLMRKMGLSDNDIDKIIRDNPHNADEQDYQMLRALQNRLGIPNALCTLLYSLHNMHLKQIYENLQNELISKDIITLKTKD